MFSERPELQAINERYGQFKDYMATLSDAAEGKAVLAGSKAQYYYT